MDFVVRVAGCTQEQAEQVIAERIEPDEDYGFNYRIEVVSMPLTVQGVVNTAKGLISEDGENTEYDRALIELCAQLMGYPLGEDCSRGIVEDILRGGA